MYFKARPGLTIIGRYTSNIKGWKKKFFFVSEDDWSSPMDYLGSLEFRDRLYNKISSLNEVKKERTSPQPHNQFRLLGKTLTRGKRMLATPPTLELMRGTLVFLGMVLELETSVVKDLAKVEKLTQAFLLPADKEMEGKLLLDETTRDFETRVPELAIDKECSDFTLAKLEKETTDLKRDKERSDLALEKLEKEVAELKRKDNLANKLAIEEFKAFEEYKEAV
ncbi:hypothetical protein Acr_02g0009940 [Actinidia rufa]|uniref:Uncharacterized protein n=1 Tax=Actinidia rufa TaxID=165716 RepID=A0A7J0E8E3_9ERIC|nr:hypothetical protein Acr_02g0009940 [Actinidia rufa]